MVLILLLSVIQTILPLLTPIIIGALIDEGILKRDINVLKKYVLIVIIISAISALLSYLINIKNKKIEIKYISRMRKRILQSIYNKDWRFINNLNEGKVINIFMYNIEEIAVFYTSNIISIINDIISSLLSILMLIKIELKLFILITIAQLLIIITHKRMNRLIQEKVNIYNKKNDETNRLVQECISKLSYLLKSNLYNFKKEQINVSSDESLEAGYKLGFMEELNISFVGFFKSVIIAMIYLYCGIQTISGIISLGMLTVFLMYSTRYISPLIRLLEMKVSIISTVESIKRVYSLESTKYNFDLIYNEHLDYTADIKLENLSFSFEGNNIINHLNHIFIANDFNIIIGRSGTGKSTLISLIQGFLNPDYGNIFIGETNIKNIDPRGLRDNISYVSQNSEIFEDTLKNNICMGIDINNKDIFNAIEKTGLEDFFIKIGCDLDYVISDNNLSGGQAQRIALCRAYVQNRDIVILDEITSNLDKENEKNIIKEIKNTFKNKTVIIITHSDGFRDLTDNILNLNERFRQDD